MKNRSHHSNWLQIKKMKEKYKDTDLREALRRKYADTPKLPENFMESMKLRTGEQTKPEPVPAAKRWRWVTVAACLLLIIGIGLTFMPTDRQGQSATRAIAKAEPKPQQTTNLANKTNSSANTYHPTPITHHPETSTLKPAPNYQNPTTNNQQPTTNFANKTNSSANTQHPTLSTQQPTPTTQLCYATHELSEDTIPYQDPARVDDFIAKMAAYNKVKEGELACSASAGSVVSAVYVFPDNQEIDLFSRLLQVACRYSEKTPGYHLNFSHQQFFFELKDMRHQLQYRWIAERINGAILLYSTNAPIGEEVSSACYQEYRDELMHTKSMNIKTRDI